MPRAEAPSWWDDVQHLKPGASSPELPADDARGIAAAPAGSAHGAERRRTRVADVPSEPRLSRAHAADFADAFDLDGAFGAPRGRFDHDADEGRVIVLERAPAALADGDIELDEDAWALEDEYDARADAGAAHVEPVAEALADEAYDEVHGEAPERDPETGRRVVRITGRPGASVAPRHLRELQPRRQRRSVAERAASRPDRVALYAVLLGLFLVVLAAASSSAHP